MPVPKADIRKRAISIEGNDSWTSAIRMISASIQPPK